MIGNKNYFTMNDNFENIIKESLNSKELLEIHQISTGWTNIVYEAKDLNNSYFFRFPRNDFWAKMIIKDISLCNFIYEKTSFKTPNMKRCYDNGRPFSMHEKIEGITLNDVLVTLNENELKKVASNLSKFIYEMNNISVENLPEECEVSLLDFLDELAKLHFEDMSKWRKEIFEKENKTNKLVHGDLNPSNVLVDEENNVVAIIDFCFGGFGGYNDDLSRIINRAPKEFKPIMIKEYENHIGEKIDIDHLDNLINAWNDIDNSYIKYIKNNNPEINL